MLSPAIKRKLSSLRLWEGTLRFLWGAARWLAVVVGLLAFACLVDWAIDRFYATPWPLRVFLFLAQVAIGLVIAWKWLLQPLTSNLSDADMALMVEEKTPVLQHRLISVIQFHDPRADTGGMSQELIVKVTEETDVQTSRLSFAAAADSRRIGWSVGILLPVVLLIVVPLLIWPETVRILLSRQALMDVDIPRSVQIAAVPPNRFGVWPKGEELVLRFKVKGKWDKDATGMVRIDPEGQPSLYYDMEFESSLGDDEAIFVTPPKAQRQSTRLPNITNFSYRAWLADGRTPGPSELKFVPRPVIIPKQIEAWTVLPDYMPLRPSKQPYELMQNRGDIVALRESKAKVRIKIQKPVKFATLQLLGPVAITSNPTVVTGSTSLSPVPFTSGPLLGASMLAVFTTQKNLQQDLLGPEKVLAELPMTVLGDKSVAEITFPLPDNATGYRLIAEDKYGFKNLHAPRRNIRIVPEEPPQVALLPVVINDYDEFTVDGLPIPPDGKFRVVYTASGPFGLGGANLHYRVIKLKPGAEEGSSFETEATPWISMPLIEKERTDESGPFLLDRGAFQHSSSKEQIQFHAVPSPNPEYLLGRKKGGGRFDYYTETMLKDADENIIPLKPGDQVEYKVEVLPAEGPVFNALRKSGFSETRVVNVVTPKEYVTSILQYDEEKARLRNLRKNQGKVFPIE